MKTVASTKSSLSGPQKRLVELMQRLNFGRIEGLVVQAGQPAFDPLPRIVRDIKIGGENGPRPEAASGDFALKSQITELLEHLSQLRDGPVEVIEVKNGLPFRLVVEHSV